MFELVYLVIYFFGTEIWFQLAKEQSEREIPYHRGVVIFSTFFHIIIFATSIRMFGAWIGITLGLLHLLSFSHALVGWIFSLPSVIRIIRHFKLYSSVGLTRLGGTSLETPSNVVKFRIAMLGLLVPVGFIHLLFAFMDYSYKGALNSYLWTSSSLTIMVIVIVSLGLFKFLIYRFPFKL